MSEQYIPFYGNLSRWPALRPSTREWPHSLRRRLARARCGRHGPLSPWPGTTARDVEHGCRRALGRRQRLEGRARAHRGARSGPHSVLRRYGGLGGQGQDDRHARVSSPTPRVGRREQGTYCRVAMFAISIVPSLDLSRAVYCFRSIFSIFWHGIWDHAANPRLLFRPRPFLRISYPSFHHQRARQRRRSRSCKRCPR